MTEMNFAPFSPEAVASGRWIVVGKGARKWFDATCVTLTAQPIQVVKENWYRGEAGEIRQINGANKAPSGLFCNGVPLDESSAWISFQALIGPVKGIDDVEIWDNSAQKWALNCKVITAVAVVSVRVSGLDLI